VQHRLHSTAHASSRDEFIVPSELADMPRIRSGGRCDATF